MEEIDTHPLACDCGWTHSHYFFVIRYPSQIILKCQVCGKQRTPLEFCKEQGCSDDQCKDWSQVCPIFPLLPKGATPYMAYKRKMRYSWLKEKISVFAGYWKDEGWYGLLIEIDFFGFNFFIHSFFWPNPRLNLCSFGWRNHWVVAFVYNTIQLLH